MKVKLIVNGAADDSNSGTKRCDPNIEPATNGLILEWTEKQKSTGGKKDPYANMSDSSGWTYGERKQKIFSLSDKDKCMDEFIAIAQEDGMDMNEEEEPSVPADKKKTPVDKNKKPEMVEGSKEEEDSESPEEEDAEGDEEE